MQQRLERASGVEHRHRDIMAAAREPGGRHGKLPLAAAHGQIADKEQHLHPDQ